MSAEEKSWLAGIWHITNMNAWDADYINMEVQAYIRIGRNGIGEFQFGLVSGQMDGRSGSMCSLLKLPLTAGSPRLLH